MDRRKLIELLRAHPAFATHPGLAELGADAFAYASVLLDDDDHLTRLGNATSEAKRKLRDRVEELLAVGEAP